MTFILYVTYSLCVSTYSELNTYLFHQIKTCTCVQTNAPFTDISYFRFQPFGFSSVDISEPVPTLGFLRKAPKSDFGALRRQPSFEPIKSGFGFGVHYLYKVLVTLFYLFICTP